MTVLKNENLIGYLWEIWGNQLIILKINKWRETSRIYPTFPVWSVLQGNQVEDEGEFLFEGIFQVINKKGIIELAYSHFTILNKLKNQDSDLKRSPKDDVLFSTTLAELFLLGYRAVVVITGYKICIKKKKTFWALKFKSETGWKLIRFDSGKKESKLWEIHI